MLVDAHAHPGRYTDRLPEAIRRINDGRIQIGAVAMDAGSYRTNLSLAGVSAPLRPVFGIHPWEVSRHCGEFSAIDLSLEQTPMVEEAGMGFYCVGGVCVALGLTWHAGAPPGCARKGA